MLGCDSAEGRARAILTGLGFTQSAQACLYVYTPRVFQHRRRRRGTTFTPSAPGASSTSHRRLLKVPRDQLNALTACCAYIVLGASSLLLPLRAARPTICGLAGVLLLGRAQTCMAGACVRHARAWRGAHVWCSVGMPTPPETSAVPPRRTDRPILAPARSQWSFVGGSGPGPRPCLGRLCRCAHCIAPPRLTTPPPPPRRTARPTGSWVAVVCSEYILYYSVIVDMIANLSRRHIHLKTTRPAGYRAGGACTNLYEPRDQSNKEHGAGSYRVLRACTKCPLRTSASGRPDRPPLRRLAHAARARQGAPAVDYLCLRLSVFKTIFLILFLITAAIEPHDCNRITPDRTTKSACGSRSPMCACS